ncbi:MAG: succinylglutamate desuccinylase/aspartoacylase family protein [Acidobacteriaceae bacterium]|nr:succinylglutamate desuccinylase/aspartoacylase family protein [Acidobacteriaceae bacterium]
MAPTVIHDTTQIDFERPGKTHYQVAFHLDSSWGYSLVPLTVINGTAGGNSSDLPGVVVFGGTHGNEYEGQVAVKRLCTDLESSEMRGRVILIPQLSETACRAHHRRSLEDGVNMNRAFPGIARGTLSYRIAHFVKRQIFPQVRVVIDIHSGGREAIFPLCMSFHPLPNPKQYAETLAVARLFDTPFIFIYSRQMASGLLTDEAEDEGKVTIGSELGHAEGTNPRGVRHAYEGVRNVLRHYGMLSGEITRIDPQRPTPPRLVQAPVLADYVPAPRSGIWEPVVAPGDDVQGGDLIGRLHDFSDHSSPGLEIRAHKTGVVIAMLFAAHCEKGVTLYVIGEDAA